MKHDIQKFKKAREMRLNGYSLSEIAREYNIPVSTLSNSFKDIKLSNGQIHDLNERVKSRVQKGRMNSLINIKSKRLFIEREIYAKSELEFQKLSKDTFFTAGLVMYWLKGSKSMNCFQFSSNNEQIINNMIKWINKYVINSEQKDLVKVRKYNNNYRIDLKGINNLRRVIAWQKLLIKYYDSV